MHSVQVQNLLFTLWCPCLEIVGISGSYCFVVLPECENLFYTLHLLNFPTNESHKLLNQRNIGENTAPNQAAILGL